MRIANIAARRQYAVWRRWPSAESRGNSQGPEQKIQKANKLLEILCAVAADANGRHGHRWSCHRRHGRSRSGDYQRRPLPDLDHSNLECYSTAVGTLNDVLTAREKRIHSQKRYTAAVPGQGKTTWIKAITYTRQSYQMHGVTR